MPVKPKTKTLTNSTEQILNAIRNSASINYQNYVPIATKDAESIKEIGAVIMDYPNLQNEFLSALVNRIARVIVTSKMYENPLAMFKKGFVEFGESIEEIFVNIAKPFEYDPQTAESEVFKREIPDVRSAFHVMNYQHFYKVTIQENDLKQAFLSYEGVIDLIAKIVDSIYTAAAYDEFLVTKYMLAKHIINGMSYPYTVPTVSAENMKKIASKIKGISNNLGFMSDKYNIARVRTLSKKDEQYLIINSDFDAEMDVEVLASAFNMSKAEFMGHRVLIDGFGELDIDRLNILFANDPTYTEISADVLNALNEIPCVLVDIDFFMIFDNMEQFTEQYNGQGLYWNYFYHNWKTFSVSPFANNIMFIPSEPTVTAVTVTPSTATVSPGQSIQLSVKVDTTNFASQAVNWSVDTDNVTVSKTGFVTIGDSVAKGTKITVTATSVYDNTKTGTATIAVA
jgi:hypothetical protein